MTDNATDHLPRAKYLTRPSLRFPAKDFLKRWRWEFIECSRCKGEGQVTIITGYTRTCQRCGGDKITAKRVAIKFDCDEGKKEGIK